MNGGGSLWRLYIIVPAITVQKCDVFTPVRILPKMAEFKTAIIYNNTIVPRGPELYVYLLSLVMLLFS